MMKVEKGQGVPLGNGETPLDNSVSNGVKQPRNVRLSLAVIGIIVGLGVGFWGGLRAPGLMTSYNGTLDYSELDEVYSVIKRNFDGDVVPSDLIAGAKKGMVAGLGDPYSQLFTYNETQEFYNELEGEFEGVGIELVNRDSKLTIASVLRGTPAEEAGLAAGDLIAKVDEIETLDWPSEAAVKIIRGAKGTQVKLTIIRDGREMEFEITRATITNPSVKWEVKDGVGVMEISRFGDSDTVRLSRQAAKEFVDKKVSGVVLDLRGNGGGFVDAAVDVASLWLENGQMVTTERRGESVTSKGTAGSVNTLRGMKTVVLVDGGSASAAEILAGALQDYGVAEVVGMQSFGKGSVQALKPLLRGDSLKITVARWFTPEGRNIDKDGITPDVEVKFDTEAYKKNGADNQLAKALEIIKK